MEEIFRELGGAPMGFGGANFDMVEEKMSADGSHHRKEVHNENGHRSVTITEEKDIEVPGATTPQEVS